MVTTKTSQKSHFMLYVLAISVTLCAILALSWMFAREVYTNETVSVRENAENIVVNNVGAPNDLVEALLAEKSGCMQNLKQKNVDYIVRVVDDYALVHFGCALDAYAFYHKTDGKWDGISPTNKFIYGTPTCESLEADRVPASIQPYCWDSGPREDGKLPTTIENPVK